uniref:Casein kinase I n=1 Tax=Spumella elongata TaxID=89044 RepID=A0A7S3H2P7_9STRA
MIGKYRITNRIAQGSFGEIYVGLGPNNEQVAIKYEKHGAKHPQLRHEYKVYRLMVNCPGFCTAQHFGTKDTYNFMIIDLLGPSLEELFNRCNRRFSMKTIIQLADQMLERVEALHTRHLIHRDIKPANFVIGLGSRAAQVFCVDFGLSKRYCDPKTMRHIFPRHDRSLTGTPRYASINNHLGVEQSRRDDLESVAYILIYFIRGQLPWQGLKSNKPEHKYRLILQKKQQVPIAQLCQGCPSQFAEFLAYTRALKFDATPDIPYLRKMFRDLYHALGCGQDPRFWDWDPLPGMSFCACPHCCPPGVIGLSPLPVPGGQLPPSSGMPPPQQQQLPPAHNPYERTDSSRSDRRDPHAPPLPPPNGAGPAQGHQRVSSSGGAGVRTSTRSASAVAPGQAQGHAQDPRTHAPMDQEVIDVLMNLH